jgi:hypothetical protein
VAFHEGPDKIAANVEARIVLSLMYFPALSYDGLTPGATFTVREGAQIVAYGTVLCMLK